MPSSYEQAARRVLARADELATYTEEPGRITRPLATPAMAGARARVREWMQAAGPGDARGRDRQPRRPPRRGRGLVIGSHLDSVADAGPLRRHPRHPDRARGRRARCRTRRSRSSPSPTRTACASRASTSAAARSSASSTPQDLGLRDAHGRHAARGDRRASPAPPLYDPAHARLLRGPHRAGTRARGRGAARSASSPRSRARAASTSSFNGPRRPRRDDADAPAPRRRRRGGRVRARRRADRARRSRGWSRRSASSTSRAARST